MRLPRPAPLEAWCRARAVPEALVGGFYVRPRRRAAGRVAHPRRAAPAACRSTRRGTRIRACVHVVGGRAEIARRDAAAGRCRAGDLLQAGPLLVAAGGAVVDGDAEGFSAGARQFDSDITAGRYPRAALALDGRPAARRRLRRARTTATPG